MSESITHCEASWPKIVAFAVVRLAGIRREEHIGARRLALQDVADGNERYDAISFFDVATSIAPDQTMALLLLDLALVVAVDRGLIDDAGFQLRQQAVADAQDLQFQLGDVDRGDGNAVDAVARQDDAAGEADQRRPVAQFHRHRFARRQPRAMRGGQAGL